MRIKNQAMRYIISTLFILIVIVSCATAPEMKINYSLPLRSDELQGKKVFLGFEDIREVRDVLGEGAKKQFRGFSGNFTLFLLLQNEEKSKIGVYDLPSLFEMSFKKSLENLGLTVVKERGKNYPDLVIYLKEFYLDLVDRKWIAKMDYEARMMVDEKVRAKQMISGQAERLKLVRQKQANIVMGEIFTDIINRLDVGKLFRQAGQ